jgi:hypothetical protein
MKAATLGLISSKTRCSARLATSDENAGCHVFSVFSSECFELSLWKSDNFDKTNWGFGQTLDLSMASTKSNSDVCIW